MCMGVVQLFVSLGQRLVFLSLRMALGIRAYVEACVPGLLPRVPFMGPG